MIFIEPEGAIANKEAIRGGWPERQRKNMVCPHWEEPDNLQGSDYSVGLRHEG